MRNLVLRPGYRAAFAAAVLLAFGTVALSGCSGSIPSNVSTACADVSTLTPVLTAAKALGGSNAKVAAALMQYQPLVTATCANQADVDAALAALQALVIANAGK